MQGYRKNVAMVVLNRNNQVLLCRRKGTENWQFPQGGIDKKETPLDAAYRELFEEVNIQKDQVELISEYPEWIKYDLPPKFKKSASPFLEQNMRHALLRILSFEMCNRDRPDTIR